MIARLLSSLRRRLGSHRRWAIATAGLLALAVVASALAPATRQEDRKSAPPTRTRTGARAHPGVMRGRPPVSAAELGRARAVAIRFLHGYLPFAYGRAGADQVVAVTATLRRQLTMGRALVAPTERRRHPRVVSLAVVGQAPRVVLATALVEDGGVTAYALRITLQEGRSGWLVSAVDGG